MTCSGHAPATASAEAYWEGARDSRCHVRSAVVSTGFPSRCLSDSVVVCLRKTGSGREGEFPSSWCDGTGSAGEGPSGVLGCRNGCL